MTWLCGCFEEFPQREKYKGEYKRRRKELVRQIQLIDGEGVNDELLQAEQLQKRYQLEEDLEKIMEAEEIYWQQRGEKSGLWKETGIPNFSI
jgi:hypothetical protein